MDVPVDSDENDSLKDEDEILQNDDATCEFDDEIDEDALLAEDDAPPPAPSPSPKPRHVSESTDKDANQDDVLSNGGDEAKDDLDDNDDEEEEKTERNKFSTERTEQPETSNPNRKTGDIPDTLDEVKYRNVGGGRGRGRGGKRDRLKWQPTGPRQPIMHLGAVKITPTRPLFPSVRSGPPIFPMISMAMPLIPYPNQATPLFPMPLMSMPPPRSMTMGLSVAHTATVHSSNQAYKSDDWLRLTEEFLQKSKQQTNPPQRRIEPRVDRPPTKRNWDDSPPKRRRSHSPEDRGRRRQETIQRETTQPQKEKLIIPRESTIETAKELGLDEEYLARLEKQKQMRLELQKKKEQRRMQEVNKKQKELAAAGPSEPIEKPSQAVSARVREPPRRDPPKKRRSRTRSRSRSPVYTKKRRTPSPKPVKVETTSPWARRVMVRDKLAGGEERGTLQGRKVVIPIPQQKEQAKLSGRLQNPRTVHVAPLKSTAKAKESIQITTAVKPKPVVHVNPAMARHLVVPLPQAPKQVVQQEPPQAAAPAPPASSGPVTIAAVVRNATPSLTAQRMKIVAGTVGLVKSCSAPMDGIITIVFFDPKHAATFCQHYNGKRMDGTSLQIALEPINDI